MTLIAIVVLALGTYLFRVAGPLLRDKITVSDRVQELMSTAAITMLLALVVTSTFTKGDGFAGWALPAGVAVGAVSSLFKAPFVLVVALASATTALARLAGIN